MEMLKGMRMDALCMDMYADMCVDICINKCISMCVDTCIGMRYDNVKTWLWSCASTAMQARAHAHVCASYQTPVPISPMLQPLNVSFDLIRFFLQLLMLLPGLARQDRVII